jgi:eukaryotic-like serine/threonine-protein kinase
VRVDGWPVLVDFGLGTYTGAPRVTGPNVPGSRLFQSPEAMRFLRQCNVDERPPSQPADDVWALGVVLYKLLTDFFPFDARHEEELVQAILTHTPPAPHERNPRVPRALGELCMRLLEKEPETRLSQARELVLRDGDAHGSSRALRAGGRGFGPGNGASRVLAGR